MSAFLIIVSGALDCQRVPKSGQITEMQQNRYGEQLFNICCRSSWSPGSVVPAPSSHRANMMASTTQPPAAPRSEAA